jgi:hypothetical protein
MITCTRAPDRRIHDHARSRARMSADRPTRATSSLVGGPCRRQHCLVLGRRCAARIGRQRRYWSTRRRSDERAGRLPARSFMDRRLPRRRTLRAGRHVSHTPRPYPALIAGEVMVVGDLMANPQRTMSDLANSRRWPRPGFLRVPSGAPLCRGPPRNRPGNRGSRGDRRDAHRQSTPGPRRPGCWPSWPLKSRFRAGKYDGPQPRPCSVANPRQRDVGVVRPSLGCGPGR